MVFFGLSLNTGILYGDYYINFLLATLMEFPGSALPIFMIDRIGRKKSYIIYMTVGGFSCLSTIFTVNYGGKGKTFKVNRIHFKDKRNVVTSDRNGCSVEINTASSAWKHQRIGDVSPYLVFIMAGVKIKSVLVFFLFYFYLIFTSIN